VEYAKYALYRLSAFWSFEPCILKLIQGFFFLESPFKIIIYDTYSVIKHLRSNLMKYILWLCVAVWGITLLGGISIPAKTYAGGLQIYVNTTNDELNTDGDCSLREAIQSANLNIAVDGCNPGGGGSSPDQIHVVGGQTYNLSLVGANENANATGDLDIIDSNPTLDIVFYSDGGRATIDANDIDRVLDVVSGELWLFDVTLTDGTATNGGIIYVGGSLTLHSVYVQNGIATNNGGGIYHNGTTLFLEENSIIGGNGSGNVAGASYGGGGIYSEISGATITIDQSTISYNQGGGGGGGGIKVVNSATLNLTDSLIDYNIAVDGEGGGLLATNGVNVAITGSTINNNTATAGDGGGILVHDFNAFSMTNSKLITNSASDGGGAIRASSNNPATVSNSCFVLNTSGIEEDV
jgi:CSLREA domain-containing protein